MKKILLLTLLFGSIYSRAQFPIQQSLGSGVTQVYSKGGLGADSGFVYRTNFADTVAANRGFIKNIPGIVIRNIDTLWQRNNAHTAWIKLGAGSGSTIDTSNKWLTSAYKRLDSVFVVKGGNEIFAYKDAGPLNQADGLLIGGVVTWTGTGLVFGVTPATYIIDGSNYTSPASSITLDAADGTFGRYDAIIVNSSGAVSKITGTAAASPVFPQIDPATQLLLTYIFVDAGATTPTQISDVVVYDENIEWTTSTTGGVTADFANTTFANHGTKSIAATWAGSSGLLFTNGSSLIGSNFSTVSFYIRLTATMANNVNVALQFYNGSTAVSNGLNCSFSKLTTGSWQLISFNVSQFTFSGAFNRIKITLTGTNASTVYFDWLRLQSNATQQPTQGLTNAYSKFTDGTTTATATGSDQIRFRTDNTMSVGVVNNDVTYGDYVVHKVDTLKMTTNGHLYKVADSLASIISAGGTPTLDQVLTAGNTSQGQNIHLTNTSGGAGPGTYDLVNILTAGTYGQINVNNVTSGDASSLSYNGVSIQSDIGFLFFLSNDASKSQGIKPQASWSGNTTLRLPNTGNPTDTMATLADVRGVSGTTTINNNADNRLITGSGSANTLEGESTLTYDGTTLVIDGSGKTLKVDGGFVNINAPSGASRYLYTSVAGTTYGYWGIAGAVNGIISGSVIGDQVFRTNTNAFMFSTDNGTSLTFGVNGNGTIHIGQLSSDPGTATNGDMYYNTSTHKFRGYANGTWVDLN
jgi:hypothetical protein